MDFVKSILQTSWLLISRRQKHNNSHKPRRPWYIQMQIDSDILTSRTLLNTARFVYYDRTAVSASKTNTQIQTRLQAISIQYMKKVMFTCPLQFHQEATNLKESTRLPSSDHLNFVDVLLHTNFWNSAWTTYSELRIVLLLSFCPCHNRDNAHKIAEAIDHSIPYVDYTFDFYHPRYSYRRLIDCPMTTNRWISCRYWQDNSDSSQTMVKVASVLISWLLAIWSNFSTGAATLSNTTGEYLPTHPQWWVCSELWIRNDSAHTGTNQYLLKSQMSIVPRSYSYVPTVSQSATVNASSNERLGVFWLVVAPAAVARYE